MTWFLLTLISPVSNALVNYIDKYLIEHVVEGRGIGSLVVFSALMGLPVAILVYIFYPQVFDIPFGSAMLMIMNGFLYAAWVLPYLYAMQKDEASIVAPMFQMSSILVFVMAFIILGEKISPNQFMGCALVLIGAVSLSIEKNPQGFKVKSEVLLLVLVSCFFIALSGVVFKLVALVENFWIASFWESTGIFLSSLLLLRVPSYRIQFFSVIRNNKAKVLGLNGLNEVIVMIGKITLNFATLLAPVSVVYFIAEGFQPFFVLLYGILLTVFFPKLINEGMQISKILHKLLAMCVMLAGSYVIYFF